MAKHLSVDVFCSSTEPKHGKGKHDAEGKVMQKECRSARMRSDLSIDRVKEVYLVSVAGHMSTYFDNNSKQLAFKRTFKSIATNEFQKHVAKKCQKKKQNN